MRIGVDAGGTFTDFVVLHDDGRLETFKLRSRPRDPAAVILEGVARVAAGTAEVVHGSTVATNALLERKGARTAFLTTAGFEDLLHIGRQNRARLYDLNPPPRRFLLGRDDCYGVPERTFYDGAVERTPTPEELTVLRERIKAADYEAVAICLLHSYRNPEHERLVRAALDGVGYVCASHEVCPEFREVERGSTTLLNAYVGPVMARYLGELERGCPHPVSILQSNGGHMTMAEARQQAVRTLLSGPAGGAIAASGTARLSGFPRVLGFDMGGTSTDVCLCDGAPQLATESSVDGFPVRVPLLDIHTVGAGGGSIARVDAGGLLRVGPESAGADPGPACYGVGELPTVTDAQVVLGRIAPDQLAGGTLSIDPARAAVAVDQIAAALGLSREAAAQGILQVADANMERAIRVVSVERGHDPRPFALVAFGGGGGLHAADLARALDMRTVVVPPHAGVLSALGMLMADRVRDYAAGVLGREGWEQTFAELEQQAHTEVPGAALERSADLRYRGQSYELTVPWQAAEPGALFHAAHQQAYGYAEPGRAVEVVTLRVRARVTAPPLTLAPPTFRAPQEPRERRVFVGGRWRRVPVRVREEMAEPVQGPVLVTDYGATTLVPPGWRAHCNAAGALVLRR